MRHNARSNAETTDSAQQVLRRLIVVWADFESQLLRVPIVSRIMRGQLRIENYRTLLSDHYHQVIEGAGWITRAASSITAPYLDQRSMFMRHAAIEHRDFELLERSYLAAGGTRGGLETAQKNIGSAALSAWMYQQASQPNPFDLLGAMFIIEGLGKRFAQNFADAVKRHVNFAEEQIIFYTYHAEHDDEHLDELEVVLSSGILDLPRMADRIVRTANVTARLYLLQLEETGKY